MNISTNREIRVSKLKFLAPVLKRWIELNEKIAHDWKSQPEVEVPWRDTERAMLSVFAAAVSREGGDVVEECRFPKWNGRSKYFGRLDVRFVLGRQRFVAEAKFCFSNRSNDIGKKFETACKDARKLRCDAAKRLGILFVQLYVGKSRARADGEQYLRRWLSQIRNVEADARALFLSDAEKIVPSYSPYRAAGAAILIREVR